MKRRSWAYRGTGVATDCELLEQEVSIVQRRGAAFSLENIRTRAAGDEIAVRSAKNHVGAEVTAQNIDARSPGDGIVPGEAEDRVPKPVTNQRVVEVRGRCLVV
jgi:hypothetical protein